VLYTSLSLLSSLTGTRQEARSEIRCWEWNIRWRINPDMSVSVGGWWNRIR
jgi:hypothetical protein